MSQNDLLILAAAAAATFGFIEYRRREAERLAALEAQNRILAAQAAARAGKKPKTRWEEVALGAIPVVGGIIKAVM